MGFIINTFFDGLTVGILIGLTLNTIKNYMVSTKWTSQNNKSIDNNQQKPSSSLNKNGEFKMALLVRHDLKMGKGKVAAQVRHNLN